MGADSAGILEVNPIRGAEERADSQQGKIFDAFHAEEVRRRAISSAAVCLSDQGLSARG
jgi:hypothetical protein